MSSLTSASTDEHYNKYLWARWKRLGRSGTAWVVLTALVALLSATPGDLLSLPEWPVLATIPATFVLVLACIAPIIYLRAKILHHPTAVQSPSAPSTRTYLSLVMSTINDPNSGRITAWYIWASVVTTSVFIHLWRWRHEAHEGLSLDLKFFKPTARHPYHINERVLFLYLGNGLFAVFLSQKDIFDGAWGKSRWPSDNASLGERLSKRAKRTRNRSLVGWTMPFRLLSLHYATAVLLRLPAIVFDISATQRLDFSPLAAGRKADSYIISALESSDDYYLTFTALELADRSHQVDNRKRVFDDLSTKPTAWTNLYQGCISQLNKSYNRLYTRGGRLSAPASSGSSGASSRSPLTSIPTAQVKQVQSVFYVPPSATKPAALVDQVKATDAKIVDMAAAGLSYIRQRAPNKDTLEHVGEKALSWISPLEEHMPAQAKPVIKSITDGAETAKHKVEDVQHQLQATSSAVTSKISSVATQVAKPADKEWRERGLYPVIGRWMDRIAPRNSLQRDLAEQFVYRVDSAFARRWALDEIDFVLPRRRIDADLMRALAAYVAASLHEDTYGQVQSCVPQIMETFLKYHSELASYKQEFFEKAEARKKEAWLVQARKIWEEEAQVLSQVIEQAVRNFQQVFGEHMKAFEISPAVLNGIRSITQEA
ncbi:hypothetical protein QFC20_005480 [Naganishia adeliensis]|uniref:Uncharacterized protein n=1 Tax=Naganishia adeliensis TaxID=92952 RepID=A0ACC2VN57_9TREE|nr:hypothetical protein QFC20_005480 [Naganishia adeliensis]